MSSGYNSVRQLIEDNNVDDFLCASNILIKFAKNVVENPSEPKYRRIRLTNPTVQTKLLNIAGGMECLFDMGFQEDGEYLYLHPDSDLQALKDIRNDLESERRKLQTSLPMLLSNPPVSSPDSNLPAASAQSNPPAASTQSNPPAASTQNNPPVMSAQARSIPSQSQRSALSYMESEMQFLGRIRDGMKRVMLYENKATQDKARQIIPVKDLTAEAMNNLHSKGSSGNKAFDLQDYLLLSLLRWFKLSFFSWVDCLPCSSCAGTTRNTGSVPPSQDDLRWGAGRVEAHTCNSCSRVTRFPRYTNAEKLLETRRGRCGEWADCFTLCCRALGFEARFAMDWTDHVWTEVFSVSQDRWLHCDPCENVCDKPLLYESGWGKKLTYVIAVAKDDVQDVSWRYSAKHQELLSRRNLVREKWLWKTIDKLWKEKMQAQLENRKTVLQQRLVKELIEFLVVKEGAAEALPGRTTGSLQWRQARGELGATSMQTDTNFVFSPSALERESEVIHICYCCASDKYIRKSSGNEEKHSWLAYTYSTKAVIRKEEFDWKMVYLAREENASSSEITWKFDLQGTDLRISKMELKAVSAVYEDASVNWRICAGENCFTQNGLQLSDFMTFDLKGAVDVSLTAVLQGGKGENAWQHSQLFRQSMNDMDSFPFEIKLFLD